MVDPYVGLSVFPRLQLDAMFSREKIWRSSWSVVENKCEIDITEYASVSRWPMWLEESNPI